MTPDTTQEQAAPARAWTRAYICRPKGLPGFPRERTFFARSPEAATAQALNLWSNAESVECGIGLNAKPDARTYWEQTMETLRTAARLEGTHGQATREELAVLLGDALEALELLTNDA